MRLQNDDRLLAIRMFVQGSTSKEVAKHFGVSRDTVAGILRRSGVSRRKVTGVRRVSDAERKAILVLYSHGCVVEDIAAEVGHTLGVVRAVVGRKPPFPVQRLKDVPRPVDGQVTFLDLTIHTCRWPYGDQLPYMFCGSLDGVEEHRPYCRAHAKIAYVARVP